ncbi:hypothetical protein C8R47DRAFT_98100 [Mycena vitilis]|nr:hypothetical protein C8R47DRAFT_98100 [Mycena vitilis]
MARAFKKESPARVLVLLRLRTVVTLAVRRGAASVSMHSCAKARWCSPSWLPVLGAKEPCACVVVCVQNVPPILPEDIFVSAARRRRSVRLALPVLAKAEVPVGADADTKAVYVLRLCVHTNARRATRGSFCTSAAIPSGDGGAHGRRARFIHPAAFPTAVTTRIRLPPPRTPALPPRRTQPRPRSCPINPRGLYSIREEPETRSCARTGSRWKAAPRGLRGT